MKRILVVLPVLILVLFSVVRALGQSTDPPPDELLARARASFATFNSALPSIDCDESIRSFEDQNGKTTNEQRATSLIWVRRQEGNAKEPFREEREFRSVNGKTYPPGTKLKNPFSLLVNGAFGEDFRWLLSEDAVLCNRYEVLNYRGGLALKVSFGESALKTDTCAKLPTPGVATFWLDRGTWQLMRAEFYYPKDGLRKFKGFSINTDFGVTPFGGKFYVIPTKVSATLGQASGNDLLVYSAEYSNCHKFDATMRILPDTIETQR
ncbi:MAG TPA: hypothetical protein VK574_02245 [Terracidiphilus sp.]|nr:hypothetical protein [Terracidiphilus sp.]